MKNSATYISVCNIVKKAIDREFTLFFIIIIFYLFYFFWGGGTKLNNLTLSPPPNKNRTIRGRSPSRVS